MLKMLSHWLPTFITIAGQVRFQSNCHSFGYCLFSGVTFKIFFFMFSTPKILNNISGCWALCMHSAWELSCFLNLRISVSHQFWKMRSHLSWFLCHPPSLTSLLPEFLSGILHIPVGPSDLFISHSHFQVSLFLHSYFLIS